MKRNRIVRLILATSLALSICNGCGKEATVSENVAVSADNVAPFVASSEVMTIGDVILNTEDLYMYLIPYATSIDLTMNVSDEERVKVLNNAITQAEKDTTCYLKALEEGIALDTESNLTIDTYTGAFISYYGMDFLSTYSVDEDTVREYFVRQRYVSLLKNKLESEAYDEAYVKYTQEYKDITFKKIYSVYFPTIEFGDDGNYLMDADGNYIKISEEDESSVAFSAQVLQKRAMEGDSLEELAKEYGVDIYSGENYLYDGGYTEEMAKYVDDLTNGDISEVIKMDMGYMIVRMDNTNEESYKNDFLSYMAKNEAANSIDEKLIEWLREYNINSDILNADGINSINLSNLCVDIISRGIFEAGVLMN